MTLIERIRKFIIDILKYYDDNEMHYEFRCFYETARRYLTMPELLEWYTLDDVVRMEYDIQHTEALQRDIEALWENKLDESI